MHGDSELVAFGVQKEPVVATGNVFGDNRVARTRYALTSDSHLRQAEERFRVQSTVLCTLKNLSFN